ncbi:unnamed protein product [Onchocerca flexuosa]|uniref:Uncharacterized protein n=1 Tax=Onchocerca flexuosa TaxID=387005 RepID=A0A183HLR6_9BILA|nr:unnamed protein product [Onchocerca flexuosa]
MDYVVGHNEGCCIAVDDFKATEKGQLSVIKGQRLEVKFCVCLYVYG